MPAGFDVTDKIKDGDNLLAVKVFTHSDATYLEKQDMLLANGCSYVFIYRLFSFLNSPGVILICFINTE